VPGIKAKVTALLEEGLQEQDEITDRILDDTPVDEMKEMLRPVVSWQVGHTLRDRTRSAEQRAFRESPVERDAPRTVTVVDELRDLVSKTFVLDDGTRVTWGEATVEQHQRRAAMLRTHADRVMMTADRHERAAALIAEGGATCLADLLDEPVVKKRQKKAA